MGVEKDDSKTIQLEASGGLGLSRFLAKAARNTAGHLSIISIVGPARAGKSLLLSVVAQAPGTFKVTASNEPATKGLELAARLWKLEELKPCGSKATDSEESEGESSSDESLEARQRLLPDGGVDEETKEEPGVDRPPEAASVEVAFLDTEGMGAQDTSIEAKQLAPAILLSKSVIFYWPGRPVRDSLLGQLGALLGAAESVSPLGEGEQGDGHLHVVLRNQRASAGVMEMLVGTEEEGEGAEAEQSRRRNAVRRQLSRRFSSLDVWAFPTPVDDLDALESGSFTEVDVRDEFVDAVDDLRAAIVPQLREPHRLEGTVVTRYSLPVLLGDLSERMENGGTTGQAEWEAARAMEARVTSELDDYLQTVRAVVEVEKSPFLPSSLQARLEEKGEALVSRLGEGLRGIHAEARDAVMQSFKSRLGKEVEVLEGRNRQCVVNHARMALAEAKLQFLELASALTDRADEYLLDTWEDKVMASFRAKTSAFYAEEPQVLRIQQELVTFIHAKKAAATERLLSRSPSSRPTSTSRGGSRSPPTPPARRPKVVLVGDSSVGKSCLMHRLVDGRWPEGPVVSTIGHDMHIKTMQTAEYGNVDLEIWDTAGQERFHAITPQHFRGAAAIIYVFDVTDKNSFDRLAYWMSMARLHCNTPDLFSLVLANKADSDEAKRQVSADMVQALERDTGIPVMETSALAGTNVEEAFVRIAEGVARTRTSQDSVQGRSESARVNTVRLRARRAASGWEKVERSLFNCCS